MATSEESSPDPLTTEDAPNAEDTPTTGEVGAERPARPGSAARTFPDIEELPYEQARDELVAIVARLEGGQVDLATSMNLWERGEALAAHCSRRLDGAEARLAQRAPDPE